MSKESHSGSHAENRDFVSNFFHALFVEAPAAALAFVKSLAGIKSKQSSH